MSESAARLTLSAKGLIMKIVGDILIIETSDPDELRREVNRALGDEPLIFSCARGGLEPGFRVLLSTIFHDVALEIAIRVENGGFPWKQNCCKLLQVYIHCLSVF
jgi:hypothetical protein